jgi:signal transduction histidine kinase
MVRREGLNGRIAKILIVDDIADNLLFLDSLLRRDDVEILKATSGRDALELLLKHDVALAIIDVQMPTMDGFELAELMRGAERTSHVPIIFVTAGLDSAARVFEGYDAGAVDFLVKPIDARILRHKVNVFHQLYQQRVALEETLRLSEELMAVVGHDLRNPLSAIIMCAEGLGATAKDPSVLGASTRIRSTGARMTQILDDVLDLSRARLSGGIPLQPRPINLRTVATKIVAEMQTVHPAQKIELRSFGDPLGEWDEGRMGQVCSNLVGNALRHGAPGGPVVVDIDGRATSEVRVLVHNDGDIPRDVMPHLFEPFHVSKRRKARPEGLGLGLYIVQHIVRAHGGRVDVRSGKGDGTTFRVTLPRA